MSTSYVRNQVATRMISIQSYYERGDTHVLTPWNSLSTGACSPYPKITGVLNPDYKVLISKRKDASGAYFRRQIVFVPKPVKLSHVYFNAGFNTNIYADGKMLYLLDPSTDEQSQDDLALKDLALGRLKRKLSSRSNQMNVMIPAVELREFRDLIKSLTFATTDLFHALISIKKSKGKSAAQFASHAWLNWSFALNPTLSDIKQLASTIDTSIKKSGGESFTDYGAAKKEWRSNWRGSNSSLYGCNSELINQVSHKLSYRYVAGYTTPLRSANNYNALDDFGLNVGSLVPALWELTAFSWLVDYFGTVGAYLEDTFVADGVNTFYVNCTKRYVYEGRLDIGRPLYGGTNTYGQSSLVGSRCTLSITDRSTLANLPTRSLRFKTADEIGKNAMNKLLNLGSILVGGRALSNKF